MTGYERSELVGQRTFASLLSPGGRIYHETHYAPALLMEGSVREIAFDIVRADGGRLPALVNSVLERGPDGGPSRVRTAVFDATDRREYERELLRAKERAEASEARATALARTLQQTFLPPALPTVPGLEVAAAYRAAGAGDEVGGDFYDVFELGTGDWVVVIGDVCGKGVEAAVVTALARHTVRAAAVNQHLPSDILRTLNEVLLSSGVGTDRFCTVAVVRLRLRFASGDGASWSAAFCCAGHPLPVLCRGRGDRPLLVGTAGSLLGVLPTVELSDDHLVLHAGDGLLLYTDGVVEARSRAAGGGDFFGEDRLVATVADAVGRGPGSGSASAQSLVDATLDAVMRFQSDEPRDDIAIVALQVP